MGLEPIKRDENWYEIRETYNLPSDPRIETEYSVCVYGKMGVTSIEIGEKFEIGEFQIVRFI